VIGASQGPISVRRAVELALDHLARRPLPVVSDFDGTLSQIVSDPSGAAILPLGRQALSRLASMPGVLVVVLSGERRLTWPLASAWAMSRISVTTAWSVATCPGAPGRSGWPR
jgi:hypothetical protein